jgi:Phospholipase_D-nuclease N-terminal
MKGRQMAQYPLLNAFLTMTFFFLWLLWIYLVVWIIIDIFRSHDLSGWAKGGWLVLIIVLPYIGALVYVIARGNTMPQRLGGGARSS